MQPSEALSASAQVAVTLAGFAGVVVAFRSRSVHEWSKVDKFRLQILLSNSALPFCCRSSPCSGVDEPQRTNDLALVQHCRVRHYHEWGVRLCRAVIELSLARKTSPSLLAVRCDWPGPSLFAVRSLDRGTSRAGYVDFSSRSVRGIGSPAIFRDGRSGVGHRADLIRPN